MVTRDIKSALLGRDVASDESDRNVDVEQHPTLQAMHVIVSIDPAVIATSLIGERQLLNQAVFCEEMQRAVDRSVSDPRFTPPHTLEYFAGSEMTIGRPDFVQDFDPLRRVLESGSNH